MAKVDYGAVALIPVGEYSASRQYHANELVGYQGSSYIALQNPPVGTLPTNTTYFMLHTEGTSIATASTPGTVKPDGTSTVVDANGAISVKPSLVQAIQDTAELATDSASKIGNVPTGKTLQSQVDGLEPRVSSSEQALTVNLLNPNLKDWSDLGLTVVKNSNITYTITGTYTGSERKILSLGAPDRANLENGKTYRLTGIPAGAENISIRIGNDPHMTDEGNGATGVVTFPINGGFKLYVDPGFSAPEGITIKPMITTNLSATYDDFVPFSGSSGKLDTDYKALSEKIGNVGNTDLQSQLNAATQSIAQNTTDIAANAAGISALNTGLANTSDKLNNTVLSYLDPNNNIDNTGLISHSGNNVCHLKIKSNGIPDIFFSSDNGQNFIGGDWLPVKAHYSLSSRVPPQTSLGAFQYVDWVLDFTPNVPAGHSMWEAYDITVPFAGAYKIIPINIFPNAEGKLVITIYNPSNTTVTNVDLLISNVTEYWVKGYNY